MFCVEKNVCLLTIFIFGCGRKKGDHGRTEIKVGVKTLNYHHLRLMVLVKNTESIADESKNLK